jgi:hypothetical protein
MDDMDEDRSNTGFAALSAVRRKSEILSDDEPAFTASTSDMVVLIVSNSGTIGPVGAVLTFGLE